MEASPRNSPDDEPDHDTLLPDLPDDLLPLAGDGGPPTDQPLVIPGQHAVEPPPSDGVPLSGLTAGTDPLDDSLTPFPEELGAVLRPQAYALRPERRLRVWEAVPIGTVAVLGSLMFAFPLAFGDGGRVVAMLGLLLCACSAGSGVMVARRLRQSWPGLPEPGSGQRWDWRFVAAYLGVGVLVGILTIWRVSRLH